MARDFNFLCLCYVNYSNFYGTIMTCTVNLFKKWRQPLSVISGNDFESQFHILDRPDCIAQLAEHLASIPKVVDSIPFVVRHIFQLIWCGYRLTKSEENIAFQILTQL